MTVATTGVYGDEITACGAAGGRTRTCRNTLGRCVVTNAIDAYEDAGISDGRIEIHARQLEASAVLTVRDSAGGIPAAALPKIFDELFTTKDPTRGTGLGLSIARHLVEQSFEGTLTVETEAGVGSCFAITLPAAREQPSAAAAG